MNKLYVFQGSNEMVTQYYFDIIIKSISDDFSEISVFKQFSDVRSLDKKNYFIVGEAKHLFALYLLGFRNFIFWAQGAVSEESYMRHHSKIRFRLLGFLERFALQHAMMCFCVSNYQVDFYERKYKINILSKTIIMPCFNVVLQSDSFMTKRKYERNTFCYIGSLAAWQCFQETVELYSKIEQKLNYDCVLKVFTSQRAEARNVIEKSKIRNYSIDFVEPSRLSEAVADCKYGFLLRKDNPVNNVATPTKLSTYLANGIIPIFSDSIKDFVSLSGTYNCMLKLSNIRDFESVINHVSIPIKSFDVLNSCEALFKDYYNEAIYTERIKLMYYKIRYGTVH